MANAVEAGWHGHDYQARFFWIHASALRDPERPNVVEVSYEADGPKGFDDIIVRYDPPEVTMGPHRISVSYHQIKYHVTVGGRFGYEDLVRPDFINATAVSVLERLRDARKSAPQNSAFTLVTVDSIKDGDPLGEIVSAKDYSLRMDRLFVAGGPRSKMGRVRKLWREHLKLQTDEELREILTGFHITSAYCSLERLRDEVNLHFRLVGLISCHDAVEFRFDAAARALKSSGRNKFTRKDFDALCIEEGWVRSDKTEEFLNVAIRSFADGPNERRDTTPENTLSLLHLFDERVPRTQDDWVAKVQPGIETFLQSIRRKHTRVRLFLDAHSSIAYLAGCGLGLKSGVSVELVQKGRAGLTTWRPDDGMGGAAPMTSIEKVGDGDEIVLAVSLSRSVLDDVRVHVRAKLPHVGQMIHLTVPNGSGQSSVRGGEHAAQLADFAADAIQRAKLPGMSRVHIFVAAPNAFMFYLGQQRESMGPCTLYEYDFGGQRGEGYRMAFEV